MVPIILNKRINSPISSWHFILGDFQPWDRANKYKENIHIYFLEWRVWKQNIYFFLFLYKHSWKLSLTFHSIPDWFWLFLLILISPVENSIKLTLYSFSFINQLAHLLPVSASCLALEEIQRHGTWSFYLEGGGSLAGGTNSAHSKVQ